MIDQTMTLDEIKEALNEELTDDWQFAYRRTTREYYARQALIALQDLNYALRNFMDNAE